MNHQLASSSRYRSRRRAFAVTPQQGYLFSGLTVDAQDLRDLVLCNRTLHNKEFYRIKNAILHLFGIEAGFDLQVWKDDEYDREGDPTGYDYAVHKHVLRRYLLGGHIFHEPTAEFYYSNVNGIVKSSPDFEAFEALCFGTIKGRKSDSTPANRDDAFDALRRLYGKFGLFVRISPTEGLRWEECRECHGRCLVAHYSPHENERNATGMSASRWDEDGDSRFVGWICNTCAWKLCNAGDGCIAGPDLEFCYS